MSPSSILRVRASALSAAVWALCHVPVALAAEPFVVKDIRVEGVSRTDPGTVFANLPFRQGDTYTDDKGAAALRALFATGLFKDVRLNLDGDTVVVVIEERPIIANVSFVGLKEFDSEALSKSLKDVGIGEGKPFDKALADRAEQELKRQYLSRSLYGAEVSTTTTPIERNRVNVVFTVTEGDPAKIGRLHIRGNTVFSEGTLLGLMDQTTSGWLTWYTKTDRYSRAKLESDLGKLAAHYQNRGYLEFAVESTQVAITPDKQRIDITINVREGQPYTVTGVRLEGNYLGREAEFQRLVAIKPGEPYRGEAVSQTQRNFSDYFGTFGYAFARIDVRPEIDRATGQVVVVLQAEPQRRVYVRRINVAGNQRTRDEVVRREFRQFESAWYDGEKIKASKTRVERLGYFKDVNIETTEVPGAPDQVDVTLTLTEQPTGSFMIGAGYSSATKVSLTGSIRQENVFGSGHYLAAEVNTAATGRSLVISTVDPYFTPDGVSRAINVFYRTSKPINNIGEIYQFSSHGGSVRFGVPFSDLDTVFFGAGYERTAITNTTGVPNAFFQYANRFGASSTAFPLTIGWQRDSRDSLISPTIGRMQRVDLELSPAGDARYAKANLQYQQYLALTQKFTLGVNGEVAWGEGIGGRPYPVFKNFYAGGLGSVRGFETNSLGPVDVTNTRSGGNLRINANAELYIPVPGAGNDKTFRFFGFVDAGNVWNTKSPYEKVSFDSIRVSAGLGISWLSPMGPLKLSYGVPVRKTPKDRIERFQFQIGTAF